MIQAALSRDFVVSADSTLPAGFTYFDLDVVQRSNKRSDAMERYLDTNPVWLQEWFQHRGITIAQQADAKKFVSKILASRLTIIWTNSSCVVRAKRKGDRIETPTDHGRCACGTRRVCPECDIPPPVGPRFLYSWGMS
jgi:hypothetical protein